KIFSGPKRTSAFWMRTGFEKDPSALKAECDARNNCATRIGQSLKDVTLPDMAQAPEILKSMIDSLEGDLKGGSVEYAKVVGSLRRSIPRRRRSPRSKRFIEQCA
ncbi:MAG: hypothetical protein ACM3JD_00105, partial [Rudaea sp.]